jgi:hypothetical protein
MSDEIFHTMGGQAPADYTKVVEQLYVAYFGRPAEGPGLSYWNQVLVATQGDTAPLAQAFSSAYEFRKLYAGMGNAQVVDQVYQNLFGHHADAAGLSYWKGLLDGGSIKVTDVVTAISTGAQGSDKVAFDAKVAAATAFTHVLQEPQYEVTLPVVTNFTDLTRGFISTILDQATLQAAIEPTRLHQTVADIFAAARPIDGAEIGLIGLPEPVLM